VTQRGVGTGELAERDHQPVKRRDLRVGKTGQVGNVDLAMVAQLSLRASERPFRISGMRDSCKSYRGLRALTLLSRSPFRLSFRSLSSIPRSRVHFCPAAECEDLFSGAKAGEIQPTVLAAPAVRAKAGFQANPEWWIESLAGPPVQIHAVALRAVRITQVAEADRARHKTRLAIAAAQGGNETPAPQSLGGVTGLCLAQEAAAAVRTLDRHTAKRARRAFFVARCRFSEMHGMRAPVGPELC
jgi:hypothetical protein